MAAARLPEAESLPDGFTVGEASSSSQSLAGQLLPALPDGFSEVSNSQQNAPPAPPLQLDDSGPYVPSPRGLGSPSRKEQMVDDVAVSTTEMGDFSVDLRADKEAERLRRFPVPLSDNSLPSSNAESNGEEVLVKDGTFAGFSEASKSRKCRMKEIKLLLESTDKNAEEKLELLQTKYFQQLVEIEQLEKESGVLRQKLLLENANRAALSGDLNKSVLIRQKLESLCRELQRQNKILLDESKKIASEEQQRRQELSTKFHNTIKEISLKLDEQGDDRIRQVKENEILREKLKHFTQQYEVREEHFSHQLRTKVLEHQLLEVKLKQQQERFVQEEAKARAYTEQISQLLLTEQDLRSQLALYGDKFEQFQDTLTKSNEVFASFKQEMEKMSKTIRTLEKENLSLKKKCQQCDVSLIELLDERGSLKKQLETTTNQKKKLEALCRILQAERKQPSSVTGSPSPEPEMVQDPGT
ncbi:beta-taxilin isoform X1 [Selaginella moellendorffii]|uniref:beta-taxilin isoform X1 n=1 Tax=Selaginella moellendorffii TaxID=88036 RepID=UPI000D1CFD0C|nr:beta-taxilin isoform X1 [Selaginella moellendorffii]|eukprot:XP_024515052.1 beta-taxilin isoform X1 [Selaginella moellendorffii]